MFFEKMDKRNIILLCLGIVFLVVFGIFLVTNETSKVKLDDKNKSQIKTKTNSDSKSTKDKNVTVKEKKKTDEVKTNGDSSTSINANNGAVSNDSTASGDSNTSNEQSTDTSSENTSNEVQEGTLTDDSIDVSVKSSNSDEGVISEYVDDSDTNVVSDIPQTLEETTIVLSPSTKTLKVGDRFAFKTKITPSDSSVGAVKYQSNKKSVAGVTQKGVVVARKKGTAIITAQLPSGRFSTAVVKVIGTNSNTSTKKQTTNKNKTNNNSTVTKKQKNQNKKTTKKQTTNKSGQSSSNVAVGSDTNESQVPVQDTNNSGNQNTNKNENQATNQNTNQTSTKRNGWVNQNGNKYYFKDGKYVTGWQKINGATYYFNAKGLMLRDTYVDYHYLRPNGKKKNKIGPFSVTMYGATAWVKDRVNVHSKVALDSDIDGAISAGSKVKILSVVHSNGYVKVQHGNLEGYVIANKLMINLPDVIPDMYYSITNSSGSIFKAAGSDISGVTGNNLYGFTKKYNAKIGKETYYAPMLYPVAVQLQKAYNEARRQGYNFKVYDTYRPYDVSMNVASQMRSLYNSNTKVRNKVDYDKDGGYWGQGWFIAQGVSGHNRGTDIDLALTNAKGRELKAQSAMHSLDTSSLVKYNNKVSNKLRSIMTSVGFETLKSEWWHFQEDDYKNTSYVSFKLR